MNYVKQNSKNLKYKKLKHVYYKEINISQWFYCNDKYKLII